ncbi:GNAT family N-acetyltransferase [Niveispirillum sp. KHB5.9]|uniref:GNAT family N-acetyltransferase n=1 Tax=Niveispirillum sp. KHB5.9 TaxID=3400269 RepID=UPI003A879666
MSAEWSNYKGTWGKSVHMDIHVRLTDSIGSVSDLDWDACLSDTDGGDDHPFLSHRFLSILEDSGAVGGNTGWMPKYLTMTDPVGRLLLAVPLFLKTNSFGDFAPEQHWVEGYDRTGRRYYPKLQLCAPFMPVAGPRLLVRAGGPASLAGQAIGVVMDIAQRNDLSGVHATYTNESQLRLFEAAGWLPRMGMQYHWHNRGYRHFDDFLAGLLARKRCAIRRERRVIANSGLDIRILTGPDLKPEHWAVFARFYADTFRRKQTHPHLPPDFFNHLGERMADRAVLIMARDGTRWVGGALHILGRDTLYTRSWGAEPGHPLLHFELARYRAIDFAIAHGLSRVEAGEGGDYKIARGYLPVRTSFAHYFTHPGMLRAVAGNLTGTLPALERQIVQSAAQSPYRTAS